MVLMQKPLHVFRLFFGSFGLASRLEYLKLLFRDCRIILFCFYSGGLGHALQLRQLQRLLQTNAAAMPSSDFSLFHLFCFTFYFFLSPFSISFILIYFSICFSSYFISISSSALLMKCAANCALAVARLYEDRYCYAQPSILPMGILVVALSRPQALLLSLCLQHGFS